MGSLVLSVIISVLCNGVIGSPKLMFANEQDIRITDAANPGDSFSIIVKDLEGAADLDFLYSDGMIFWTDINTEMILRAYINNSKTTIEPVITTGLLSPDGLACDWIGRKLYWSDSETNKIEVSNLDGSYRKVLYWTDLDQPRALALDPAHGYMYWTDWGEFPRIERAGMDDSQATRSVMIDDNISWPNGLTIDYEDSKLFWTDAKLGYINSCNLRGKNRRVVTKGNLPHPFSLTVYQDTLYWTDWQTEAIQSCNKRTGKNRTTVLGRLYRPMGIRAYMPSRQLSAPSPCGDNNGGCSHLCLLSPTDPHYKCACPTGVRLHSDGKTCAEGPEEMLLLARRTDLRQISLDTPDYTSIVLPLNNISHAIAIDYDPVEGYVYWTDDDVKLIRRTRLHETEEEILVSTEVEHPDGIAVDWIGRNLYWTDTGTDRIEVARLDGSSRLVLISTGLDEPRAICLDPQTGYLYWTDWGESPKIERAFLDGSNREMIIHTGLGWPNGLAIDSSGGKIFWGDAKTDKIEMAYMNGTGRRVILDEYLPHIFGFSLLGDYIYWTDWQRRSIERVNKRTGGNRSVIVSQLPDLMGLKAVDVRKKEGTNACAYNNGGCSHLCLYTPNGPICACPQGQVLDGRNNCVLPEGFILFTQARDINKLTLGDNPKLSTVLVKGVKAFTIDIDSSNSRIYWIDEDRKKIGRAFLNGSNIETVLEDAGTKLQDIAVDWVGQNIYWIDAHRKRIEVARSNGSSRRVLVWKNLVEPKNVALDPSNGFMYWTNNKDTVIERAGLDGSNRTIVLTKIDKVFDLTVDSAQQRIFWTETSAIESAQLDGLNRKLIASTEGTFFVTLTLHQDFVYCIDKTSERIEKVHKISGKDRSTVWNSLSRAGELGNLVSSYSRQSGNNSCYRNNGGCSHLCFAQPDAFSESSRTHLCSCPTHYSLNPDNKTCTAPKSFLVLSDYNTISRLVMEKDDPRNSLVVSLPLRSRKMRAVEYDPVKQFIYWTTDHEESRKVVRAKDDGTQMEVIIQRARIRPYDLAIDPYSQILFWSCSLNNLINFTRIDVPGSTKVDGVIINSGKPRFLALNPYKGHIYWTDLARPRSIKRSSYDGSESIAIITKRLGRPGPLTIDLDSGLLFWVELDRHVIGVSDLSGENRRTLTQRDYIQKVAGITVFDDYLYMIIREENGIRRVAKNTVNSTSEILNVRSRHMKDIHSVKPLDLTHPHPCMKGRIYCSHICIAKTNVSARCLCPKNFRLQTDERTCRRKHPCGPDQFTCESGIISCIPKLWHCDGYSECEDESDEINCGDIFSEPICNATQYLCSYGQCPGANRHSLLTSSIGREERKHYEERNSSTGPQLYCEDNRCIPCSQESTYDTVLYNYCFATFVVKTKIQKVVSYISGDRRLILRGKRKILKNISTGPYDTIEPFILSDSWCGCEVSPSTDENMLIMGIKHEHGYRHVVTYMSQMLSEKEFKRAMRAISKNYTCSSFAKEIISRTDTKQ